MLTVKIFGSGCANRKKLETVVREAAGNAGIDAELIKVTDIKDILACEVMSSPPRVINEKVSSGRIPTVGGAQAWLSC